jgi:hypothetical protein
MDQDQIEIVIVKDSNSAEFEEPAGAAVGEAFDAHEGSKEADFWEPASESKLHKWCIGSPSWWEWDDLCWEGNSDFDEGKAVGANKNQFVESSVRRTEQPSYHVGKSDLQKRGGHMQRQERDLSSGRIFQRFSGLAYHGSGAIESVAVQ